MRVELGTRMSLFLTFRVQPVESAEVGPSSTCQTNSTSNFILLVLTQLRLSTSHASTTLDHRGVGFGRCPEDSCHTAISTRTFHHHQRLARRDRRPTASTEATRAGSGSATLQMHIQRRQEGWDEEGDGALG